MSDLGSMFDGFGAKKAEAAGSIVTGNKPAGPPKPSPALLTKVAEALAAADAEREARTKADALKKELLAQMM